MLADQFIAVHDAATECLSGASAAAATMAVRDMELRHAEKLLNLHTRLLENYEQRGRLMRVDGGSMTIARPGLPRLR